ncbi:hypothetical protein CHELA20_53934 [Hyphomicrobiales bacterium]|nr:hypothetical protein CHELA41_20993 [Hyphomicrobiales bacterium]CAH1685256.1 hypothetical protein CHELA20_53934 [Hyphomicrobiales bacterium]
MARVLRKLLRHQPDATDREGHIRAILELSFPLIADELRDVVRALSEGVLPNDAIGRTLAGSPAFSDPQDWSDDEQTETQDAIMAAAALYTTLQPLPMPELRDRLLPCSRPGASFDMAAWWEMPFWTVAEPRPYPSAKIRIYLTRGRRWPMRRCQQSSASRSSTSESDGLWRSASLVMTAGSFRSSWPIGWGMPRSGRL